MKEALEEKERSNDKDFTVETPMMKIINFHIKLDWWVSRLQQLNLGLGLSKETMICANRMPWKATVEKLRLTSSTASFPKAVTFSEVRKLAEMEWDKSESGNRPDPFNLMAKPWKGIQRDADAYLNSFLCDVW